MVLGQVRNTRLQSPIRCWTRVTRDGKIRQSKLVPLKASGKEPIPYEQAIQEIERHRR
jgi:hypothetical protein